MESKLLVTTALEESWGFDEDIIFLGEWCKQHSRKHIWIKRSFDVCDYHWRDREKLKVDHDYLEILNEDFLKYLSNFLNKFHGVNKDPEYWRIIIGPWLLNYIPVLWDRWELLSSVSQKGHILETKLLKPDSTRTISKDYSNAIASFDADWWNHQIFSEILLYRDDLDIKITKLNTGFIENSFVPTYPLSKWQKFITFVINTIDQIIELFSLKKRKLVLFHSYFPRRFLLKLYFRLRLFPRSETRFNKAIIYPKPLDRNNLDKVESSLSSDHSRHYFENFVMENILRDLPISYLEGYKTLLKMQSQFCEAENIFTANAHFASELFKVWSAEQQFKGANLIISTHGGALYPLYTVFDHQEKIADYRIVWGLEWMRGQTRMPANKLNAKVQSYNSNGDISLIDYDGLKYSYRCAAIPMGPLAVEVYNQNKDFINCLSQDVRKKMKVRPFPLGGWETKDRYIDDFGFDIISSQGSLSNTILNSRLVICAYPQTTFSEAMYSGIPTMILFHEEFWEVQPIYNELISLLKEAGIMYTDKILAAQHVESIASDPMTWWNEPKTILAREKFNDLCLTIESNPMDSWVELFRAISAGGSSKR